ncbi:MAG: diacylglycerol kinase family lipid kinase [Elusimicrobia bacterium]|nr:diacylglycerol kinase family lipid kinase [Elusimicrobiota bacterium]
MSYFFIINPAAGKAGAARLPELIHDFFKGRRLHYELAFTERRGHAAELSRKAVINGFFHVVAAGGDGTIREAAEPLIGRTQALGILPGGSGNGLARNLYIPLKIEEALNGLLQWRPRKIDAGLANGKPFFCAAGVGLDAEVARIFNSGCRRGILPYVYHSAVTFLRYRPGPVVIVMNGRRYEFSPMVTAILNGRQYGGGAVIAPDAYIDDGILNVVVVKKAGILRTLRAVPDLFNGTLPRHTDLVTTFTARTVELSCPAGSPYHLDGEDFESDGNLRFSVLHQVLNVIAP